MTLLLWALMSSLAFAEEGKQPYIDHLRETMTEKTTPSVMQGGPSYIDEVRSKLKDKPSASSGSYIEHLKNTDPNYTSKTNAAVEEAPGSYLERERLKLENKEVGSAIQEFKEGRSELKAKKVGSIHHAMGFRLGAAVSRTVGGNSDFVARPYSDMYGEGWIPDFSLHYEFQPFHSEWFGNVSIFSEMGLTRAGGNGFFKAFPGGFSSGGQPFSSPKTKFQFFTVPTVLGLNYRFNLFRIFRPYVAAGPSLIGWWETRNDNKDGYKGYSKGIFMSGGVSVLLDWMNAKNTWDLYADYGFHHSYLTIDYVKMTSLASEVDFSNSGICVGFLFEY